MVGQTCLGSKNNRVHLSFHFVNLFKHSQEKDSVLTVAVAYCNESFEHIKKLNPEGWEIVKFIGKYGIYKFGDHSIPIHLIINPDLKALWIIYDKNKCRDN